MQSIVTPEYMQKKELDAFKNGLSPLDAMAKAGAYIFEEAKKFNNVLIVAGCGNNGGDGFRCAQLLNEANIKTDILVVGDINKLSEHSRYFYNLVGDLIIDTPNDNYDCIVDALFGIGFRGELKGDFLKAVDLINSFRNKAFIIAVDIPSGLNGLTGEGKTSVQADLTVTFQAKKIGHIINNGADKVGNLIVKDIGIPLDADLKEPSLEDIRACLPQIKNTAHKGTLGHIGIVAGSLGMEGAAVLASESAIKMGAGKVTLAVEKDIIGSFCCRAPEIMVTDRHNLKDFILDKNVILFGSGIGRSKDNLSILNTLLENCTCPLVIDADGLYFLTKEMLKKAKCPVILTPHLKEACRLFDCDIDDVVCHPLEKTQEFLQGTSAAIILKSNYNILTDGNFAYITAFGCCGMATAGSGDVLAGIVSGAINLTKSIEKGCLLASYIHGFAGRQAQKEKTAYAMTASDIKDNIYTAFKSLKGSY